MAHTFTVGTKGQDSWLEVQLAEEWVAACRVSHHEGRTIITELRVFPGLVSDTTSDPDIPPGRPGAGQVARLRPGSWDPEAAGDREQIPIPETGLTSTVTDKIKVGEYRRLIAERAASMRERALKLVGPLADERLQRLGEGSVHPGRRGHDDSLYARIALRYVEGVPSGKPIPGVADEEHISRDHARDLVREARLRGFLTSAPGKGVPGGELTTKALEVLSEIEEEGGEA